MGSPEDTGPWQSSSMNSSSCLEVRLQAVSRSGTSSLTTRKKKKCIFDMVRPTYDTKYHDIIVNAPIADLVLVKATVTDELLLLVVVEAVRTRLLPASALTKAPMRLLLPPEAVGVAGSFHTTDWTGIPYVFICCSYS